MKVDATVIDRWHRERGWLKIGYHYVIGRDGTIEIGRDVDSIGAHAKGYNKSSIGICLIGGLSEDGEPENNYTDKQWDMLWVLVKGLETNFPESQVIGHNNVSSKSCPNFVVGDWYANGYRAK
jgi:N-acetyl-anhydromuramyl-L-alanine amidase AmpD